MAGTLRSVVAFPTTENIYKFKVVLVGDISVGKTSLALRFAQNRFDETYKQTIGASFIAKTVHVNDDVISFQIWDTAGQERYKSLVPMYLRGAHIAFVVYDVNDPQTFSNLNVWMEALQHHGDLVRTIIVANKCDLESKVEHETALEVAQEHGIPLVEASAKTGYNVDKLFLTMGSKVIEDIKKRQTNRKSTIPKTEPIIVPSKDDDDDDDDDDTDTKKRGRKRRKPKCCKTH